MRSVREIIERGLFDRTQEVRYRTLDTMRTLDSEPRRVVLARQGILRARFERLLDSLSLDALAYPAVRQKPVLVGEVQTGSTCLLSAHSGLPALAMPAGFTADGLPVSVELLGRRWHDARLVQLAYAFEQANPRRRAPFTTPALVRGAAPAPVPVTVGPAVSAALSAARFRWDPVGNALTWSVEVRETRRTGTQAVVLRRLNADSTRQGPTGSTRVITRLLGPGMARASGALALNGFERRALESGRLSIAVYGSSGASPLESTLRPASR